MKSSLALLGWLLIANVAVADKLVLVAGGGTETTDVPATKAKLIQPFGVDFDKSGHMYLVELTGQRVLRVDPRGTFSLLGGTGKKGTKGDGGPAREAEFNGMHSLAVAPDGTIYLGDTWNNRVRKIDPKTGIISAVAGTGKEGFAGDGGPALKAEFHGVFCIALDPSGKKLYVTDLGNRRIRLVELESGTVTTVAGTGAKGVPRDGAEATKQPLVDPRAACVDRHGNLWILERSGHALRQVDPQGKIRTVVGTGEKGFAGDGGPALKAKLNGPKHLCMDLDDNVIIADTANHVIRKYLPKEGKIVRIAGSGKKGASGTGGPTLEVSMNEPHGVYVHPSGTLYIVDSMNHRVFRLEK